MAKAKSKGLERVLEATRASYRRGCQVCALSEEARALVVEAVAAKKAGEPITRSALERVLREDYGYKAKSTTTMINHLQNCVGGDPWATR